MVVLKRLYLNFFKILTINLFLNWSVVSLESLFDDPMVVLMWKVDILNSELSIVPFSQIDEQFVPENALVIWKGYLGEDVDQERFLHYWLGKDVSPELASLTSTLAMRAALEKCRNRPVIYREVQGYESEIFRSYFEEVPWEDHDMDYDDGKLYYIKGKNHPRIKQVQIEPSWLTKDGCIVLEARDICLYCAKTASLNEVAMAEKLVSKISAASDEEKLVNIFLSGRSPPSDTKRFRRFLSQFHISRGKYLKLLRTPSVNVDDKDFEEIRDKEISIVLLYTSRPNEGLEQTLNVTDLKLNRPLRVNMLHDQFCMVIDSASLGGIFIWIGAETHSLERIDAARVGEEMITSKSYAFETPITVVERGEEPLAFKIIFIDGLDED